MKPWLVVIMIYTSAIFLCETAANVMMRLGRSNNLVYSFTPIIEYGFLAYFFSLLSGSKKASLLLKLSIPLFIVLWAILTFGKIPGMQTTGWFFSFSYLLIIFYSIIGIISMPVTLTSNFQDTRFWAIVLVLIYTSGDLITCITSSLFLSNMGYLQIVWIVHLILAIIVNLCWAVIFLCQYRHPSSG